MKNTKTPFCDKYLTINNILDMQIKNYDDYYDLPFYSLCKRIFSMAILHYFSFNRNLTSVEKSTSTRINDEPLVNKI